MNNVKSRISNNVASPQSPRRFSLDLQKNDINTTTRTAQLFSSTATTKFTNTNLSTIASLYQLEEKFLKSSRKQASRMHKK
jgi:hypothetical protein